MSIDRSYTWRINKLQKPSKTSATRASQKRHIRSCRRSRSATEIYLVFQKRRCKSLHYAHFYSDFAFTFSEIQTLEIRWYHAQSWPRIFCYSPISSPESGYKQFFSTALKGYARGSWKNVSKAFTKNKKHKYTSIDSFPIVSLYQTWISVIVLFDSTKALQKSKKKKCFLAYL